MVERQAIQSPSRTGFNGFQAIERMICEMMNIGSCHCSGGRRLI
jgi:hypothetical protein